MDKRRRMRSFEMKPTSSNHLSFSQNDQGTVNISVVSQGQ